MSYIVFRMPSDPIVPASRLAERTEIDGSCRVKNVIEANIDSVPVVHERLLPWMLIRYQRPRPPEYRCLHKGYCSSTVQGSARIPGDAP